MSVQQFTLSAVGTKVCRVCKVEKPKTVEFFPVRDKSRGWLRAECQQCIAALRHARYIGNREKILEQQKGWRRVNAAIKSARDKLYREANRARVLARKREYYRKNKERIIKEQSEYQKKNWVRKSAYLKEYQRKNAVSISRRRAEYRKERASEIDRKGRVYVLRRRARRKNLPCDFTKDDMAFGVAYWRNSCAVCGQSFDLINKLHWDHWIPIVINESRGTVPTNMVPLCDGCNQSKSDRDAEEWLREKYVRRWRAILVKVREFFERVRQTEGVRSAC